MAKTLWAWKITRCTLTFISSYLLSLHVFHGLSLEQKSIKRFAAALFSPFAPLLSPLPRCLLELSLESDLYYLSLTLSPQLCLFLSLNGDLDKRVWAAREWSLHTKRQTKRTRERPEWRASESQIYWAICTLFQTHPVARKLHASLLFVCLLASLYENYQAEFHKIWVKGEAWAKE